MRARHFGTIARSLAGAVLVQTLAQLVPPSAAGEETVVNTGALKLAVGMRIQPRMEFERVNATSGGREWQRDFLIRRTRIKLDGKVNSTSFVFEWKIDRTDQIGQTPSASAENAYIQIPLGAGIELRAGLYDQPFSRDRLTSDSKQLVVDRGAVSDVPDALGLADNAIGFHFLGKVRGGHVRYQVGAFDNRLIPGKQQDIPMVVGRLDFDLGSTADIYRDAHFGTDRWFSVGFDGSYQAGIENAAGADEGTTSAAGADGMVDLPFGPGRLFGRGEVNVIKVEPPVGGNSLDTATWMVGAGYLMLNQRLQPTVRFDQVILDDAVGGGTRNITYVGANLYQKGHNLKYQADVRFEAGTTDPVDGFRLQAQVDF